MNHEDIVKLHQWYDSLQRTKRGSEIIGEIEVRTRSTQDQEIAKNLTSILASELRRQEKYPEAEATLLDLAAKFPDDPAPLISLAEQKLYFEQDPGEALSLADSALARAHGCGNFRRQALGVKARIAVKLGRYDLVEGVLQTLMSLTFEPGNIDVGVERDFFDRIPPEAIDRQLVESYDLFARSDANRSE